MSSTQTAQSPTLVLQAKEVSKSFGTPPQNVLKGIDLEIFRGDFVSLVGRSGSGKSTLLYILSSLDSPSQGSVELNGKNVQKFSQQELHDFRNQKIGFVFQFHYLLPELTALENILMPARKFQQQNEKVSYARELLKEFLLEGKENSLPSQLSGGEQQRVAIARALIMNPEFLFADEPTGNLDSINGNTVMNLIQKINRENNTTVVMVTHDPEFARKASRIVQLADGKIVSNGK
jgi:ABC-type lipoprotein export system ATPase subunit